MKIVTVISNREDFGYKNFLEASCKYHDLPLVVLEHSGEWGTHRLKDQYLLKYLDSVSPTEIILFTDGYDTLFLSSEEGILKKYHKFKKPIVFTAEKNCWPYTNVSEKFPKSPTIFKYLNSGGFIGTAIAIKFLLRKYKRPPSDFGFYKKFKWNLERIINKRELNPDVLFRWSNQYYWTFIYLNNQSWISLDYHNRIFLELSTKTNELLPNGVGKGLNFNLHHLYEKEVNRLDRNYPFIKNGISFENTTEYPCQIHFNGPLLKKIALNDYFANIMPWNILNTQDKK